MTWMRSSDRTSSMLLVLSRTIGIRHFASRLTKRRRQRIPSRPHRSTCIHTWRPVTSSAFLAPPPAFPLNSPQASARIKERAHSPESPTLLIPIRTNNEPPPQNTVLPAHTVYANASSLLRRPFDYTPTAIAIAKISTSIPSCCMQSTETLSTSPGPYSQRVGGSSKEILRRFGGNSSDLVRQRHSTRTKPTGLLC